MAVGLNGPVELSGVSAVLWYLRLLHDPLHTIMESHAVYGPLISLPHPRLYRKWPRPFLVAIGANFNREVLGNPTEWRPVHLGPDGPKNTAARRVGMGIIRMRGRQHAHYRRLVVPILSPQSVNAMGDKMVGLAWDEVGSWPTGRRIDLCALAQKLMRALAIGLLFGDDRVHGYPVADMIGNKVRWSILAAFCPVMLPGTAYYRMMRQSEGLERSILEWANSKRDAASASDLLSIIVSSPDENGNPVSDEGIVGQVPTLFGAAYETCQNALIWTLLLLSQHPQTAQALCEELRTVAAPAITPFARLIQLPLLAAIVKESMRILPPVPQQIRVALRPTTLAGSAVPPETRVLLSALLTNRDPDLYPEPDRFKPERWATINPSPYEYAVFSGGPRGCPGYWFAQCAVKAAVAAIFARYRVAVVPHTRIDCHVRITMSPRRSIPAVLHRQDGAFAATPIWGDIRKLVQFPK